MGLRPQTLYEIADFPVGLAAYFLDHDARSYELITRVFEGKSEGLTRDDILDNIAITWLTNTALSSARLSWEFWGTTIVELGALMNNLEADSSVKVVLFQPANPDFFVAHLDVAKAVARPEALGVWREPFLPAISARNNRSVCNGKKKTDRGPAEN